MVIFAALLTDVRGKQAEVRSSRELLKKNRVNAVFSGISGVARARLADLDGAKSTSPGQKKLDHFGPFDLANAKVRFGIRHFDQNGRYDHVGSELTGLGANPEKSDLVNFRASD